MAFVSGVSIGVRSFLAPTRTLCTNSDVVGTARVTRRTRAKWNASYSPPGTEDTSTSTTPATGTTTTPTTDDDVGTFDGQKIVDKANELVADVADRPAYYTKLAGYIAGGLVVLTIVKSVVSAVDSIPVLPGALELIGLGYTAWFVWRYLIFSESREELLSELEDLIGRARPGSND